MRERLNMGSAGPRPQEGFSQAVPAVAVHVGTHAQLLDGRLRSTTASCSTTAPNRKAPTEVIIIT